MSTKEMPEGGTDDEPEIVIGGRGQLAHLLAEASEVEHTLMCTYLYAAFSLRPEAPDLTEAERQAVAGWRKTILSVAVEEMGHLLLVANLATAIGGRPHFGRPNFPIAPGYFPADVVVRLAPFSPETLDHFIFLERPRGVDLEDGAGFEPEDEYGREEAYHGVMPSIQDYATIGRLYDAIRANLIASTRRIGETELFIGPACAQVGRAVVDMDGVAPVTDLATALAAIDTIVDQGEGSPSDREASHYQRFLGIRAEYDALAARNPGFRPAWPAAENPVMRRPPDPAQLVFIEAPAAARVLDFGNAVYAMILQLIVQSFGRTQGDVEAEQSRLMGMAIDLMHVLGAVGRALAEMPATLDAETVNAGLSFTMTRSIEPLFEGEIERCLIAERLRELLGAARVAAKAFPGLEGIDRRIEACAAQLAPRRCGP